MLRFQLATYCGTVEQLVHAPINREWTQNFSLWFSGRRRKQSTSNLNSHSKSLHKTRRSRLRSWWIWRQARGVASTINDSDGVKIWFRFAIIGLSFQAGREWWTQFSEDVSSRRCYNGNNVSKPVSSWNVQFVYVPVAGDAYLSFRTVLEALVVISSVLSGENYKGRI